MTNEGDRMAQTRRTLNKRDCLRILISLIVAMAVLEISYRLLPPNHPAIMFIFALAMIGIGIGNVGFRAMKSWRGALLVLSACFFGWTIYFGVRWLEFAGFVSVGAALAWFER